jgi:hypothetical protein
MGENFLAVEAGTWLRYCTGMETVVQGAFRTGKCAYGGRPSGEHLQKPLIASCLLTAGKLKSCDALSYLKHTFLRL